MQEVTSKDFTAEVLQSELPVLVDFWAPWCGPCKALAPTVEKLSAELAGKVKITKCDIDQSPEIATQYSIMSIPTILIFHKGEIVAQLIGLVQKDKILDKLRPYI
jgi:thioredoxin 1